MTASEAGVGTADKPLWRKIVDFPLVAMIIAAFSFLLLYGLIAIGMRKLFPVMAGDELLLLVDVLAASAMILLYKGFIRHLGDPRQDDLPAAGALRQTLVGVAIGTLLFAVVVAVAAVLGIYRIDGLGSARGLVPALIASAIFPGISEELFFRGILFRWIEQFGGSWLALLVTSVCFGAAHLSNPNASWIGAIGIALEAGVMLGAAYMLTRSLWLPIGLHAAWNFTQGEIFDVPVSGTSVDGLVQAQLSGPALLTGGAFGLEASLIAIVIATAFGLWLLWLAIRKGELMAPMWFLSRRPARHLAP